VEHFGQTIGLAYTKCESSDTHEVMTSLSPALLSHTPLSPRGFGQPDLL